LQPRACSRGRERARPPQALAPRLPLLGRLPAPPLPPLWVPGLGVRSVDALLAALAPPLSAEEGVYLQSLRALAGSFLGARRARAI